MNSSKISSIRTAISLSLSIAPFSVVFPALAFLVVLASSATPASAQAVDFGSVNVCPSGKTTPATCAVNKTVTFDIPAGTTIGSIAIVTTGIADLDFKAKVDDISTTLCKAETYGSATTCTVDVTFAPLLPGARKGAVELLDGAGALLKMRYAYGVGIGAQMAFSPYAQLYRGDSTIEGANGIAIDAAGNIFVSAYDSHAIKEIVAAGGYTTIKTINVDGPAAITMDGAGNLFVFEDDAEVVREIRAVGGYRSSRIVAEGYYPGLVVDSAGNLFVANPSINEVFELLAAGDYTTIKTLTTGIEAPFGMAIDSAGNLFVVGLFSNSVEEILAAGGYTTVKAVVSGLELPNFVAVDEADNIFVQNVNRITGATVVSEISAAGGYTTSNILNSPDIPSQGLAVDSVGNVYIAYFSGPPIMELLRSQPPAFAFADTTVGTTSSDSPRSATVQNIGNASLAFSALSFSGDAGFGLLAGPLRPPACSTGVALASSAECNLKIDFTPQAVGPLTSSLILTDNAGNTAGGTQSIDVSGTGFAAVAQVSPTVLQFGSIPYSTTGTKTLTVTNISSGTLMINPSSNGPSTAITGSTCGAGLAAGKSCALQVEFKPVKLGPSSNTLTLATSTGVGPRVPVYGTATGVGSVTTSLQFGTVTGRGNSAAAALTVTNYGVPGNVTVAASTANVVSFKVISNGCIAGITPGASCQIEVDYEPAAQGTQTAYLKLIPSTGPVQYIRMTGTLVP